MEEMNTNVMENVENVLEEGMDVVNEIPSVAKGKGGLVIAGITTLGVAAGAVAFKERKKIAEAINKRRAAKLEKNGYTIINDPY